MSNLEEQLNWINLYFPDFKELWYKLSTFKGNYSYTTKYFRCVRDEDGYVEKH